MAESFSIVYGKGLFFENRVHSKMKLHTSTCNLLNIVFLVMKRELQILEGKNLDNLKSIYGDPNID